jgi:hypothetical protein
VLSEKQLELAKNKPKEFLQQYALLKVRANVKLERIDLWQEYQEYEPVQELCRDIFSEAKELMRLAFEIEELIKQADISDQYKTVLYLRYIEGKTAEDSAKTLGVVKRWCQRLQAKALDAFAQAM